MMPGEEGAQVPGAMPADDGWVTAGMLREGGRVPVALLRAEQPAGAVFALGWVMAELFDPRRRVSAAVRQPPFDPDTQLPLVMDLAADPKLAFLAAELAEYLHWFPHLARPLRRVTVQANKKRAAIAAENLATAEAAEAADATPADDVARRRGRSGGLRRAGRRRARRAGRRRTGAVLGDGIPRRRDGAARGHPRRVR
jgi:hypothetical protein